MRIRVVLADDNLVRMEASGWMVAKNRVLSILREVHQGDGRVQIKVRVFNTDAWKDVQDELETELAERAYEENNEGTPE